VKPNHSFTKILTYKSVESGDDSHGVIRARTGFGEGEIHPIGAMGCYGVGVLELSVGLSTNRCSSMAGYRTSGRSAEGKFVGVLFTFDILVR